MEMVTVGTWRGSSRGIEWEQNPEEGWGPRQGWGLRQRPRGRIASSLSLGAVSRQGCSAHTCRNTILPPGLPPVPGTLCLRQTHPVGSSDLPRMSSPETPDASAHILFPQSLLTRLQAPPS